MNTLSEVKFRPKLVFVVLDTKPRIGKNNDPVRS